LSVLRDILQTLIDEALSSYSITLLPLSALFGDVHASQSKQQQHQLELSLSVSHDDRQTLFGEPLSSYFIMIHALSALVGVVGLSQLNQQQRQLELSLSDLCNVRLMLTKTQRLELSKFALSDTRDQSIISLLTRSLLTLRNGLDFLSTALCGSSRWQHPQQHCPSHLNLDRYALLTATLPSLLRTSCSLLKVSGKLQECINPSLHDKIRIKNTTLLKAICAPTILGTQEQMLPRALDYDAQNASPEIVDRAILSTAPLKIYFQNISGMRTKAEANLHVATGQCCQTVPLLKDIVAGQC